MDLMLELNRGGTTIIQVTHDDDVAEYGNRIIELRDGWVTSDERRA
jgi:putative ABC transport system ATP-binding protein